MKKNLWTRVPVTACSLALALSLGACGGGQTQTTTEEKTETTTTQTAASTEAVPVMTYAEYAEAAIDDPVTIEAYVQAKQSWWENKATIYAQDKDGGYFIYNATCTEDDYAKLTEGTKIRVSGYKAEWCGETEVAEGATVQILADADTFVSDPVDVTDLLESDELIDHQNQKVAFTDLEIAASEGTDGKDVAFLYGADGTGSQGDDLYFDATDGTKTYTFTVESYLCDKDTDVYKAVEALKVGDKVDLEGFLYWYEGANPHITKVSVK